MVTLCTQAGLQDVKRVTRQGTGKDGLERRRSDGIIKSIVDVECRTVMVARLLQYKTMESAFVVLGVDALRGLRGCPGWWCVSITTILLVQDLLAVGETNRSSGHIDAICFRRGKNRTRPRG